MVLGRGRIVKRTYGYGIVDRYGIPWWDEACVCKDRAPLQETATELNDDSWQEDDGRTPYRVVRLFWENKARKK